MSDSNNDRLELHSFTKGAGGLSALRVVPGSADSFKEMCRGIGSTVALVATEDGGRRYAMVATSTCSVSLEPPSLLICVNTAASAYQAVVRRSAFSLGVLPSTADEIGRHVSRTTASDRFSRGNWQELREVDSDLDGLPYLSDAQATAFCQVERSFDYGSHSVFVARVGLVALAPENRDPLLYCEGRFGRFEPCPQSLEWRSA